MPAPLNGLASVMPVPLMRCSVNVAPPATNDNFSAAQPLSGASGQVTGSNLVATKEPGEPNHAGNSGENLGLLRRLAISLLKQEKTSKASLKTKRLRCGWDDDYLAKVITSAGLEDA